MSIAKYIQESRAAISKHAEQTTKKLAESPYPVDEIIELRESEPESVLAKMYGPDGELGNHSGQLHQIAARQVTTVDKLYRKLVDGEKALKKKRRADFFSTVSDQKIEDQLRAKYNLWSSGILSADPKAKLKEYLYGDFEDFESSWMRLTNKYWRDVPSGEYAIPTGNHSIELGAAQAIYKEWEDTQSDSSVLPEPAINDASLSEDSETSEESSINSSESKPKKVQSHEDQMLEWAINGAKETKRKRAIVSNDVISDNPELPNTPEVIEEDLPLDDSSTAIETKPSELPTKPATSPVNAVKTKGEEKQAKIKADAAAYLKKNMSIGDMMADINNTVNEYNTYSEDNSEASSEINSLYSDNSSKVIDESKENVESNSSSSVNSNSSTNKTNKAGDNTSIVNSNSKFNTENDVLNTQNDFMANGQASIDQLMSDFNLDDSDIQKAQDKIAGVSTSTQSKPAELPGKKQVTEISKSIPSLPSKSKPVTNTEKETNNSATKTKETVQVKEIGSTPQTVTQSTKEASQEALAQIVNIDLSQLDIRLARIEYALANTLEVKIVE